MAGKWTLILAMVVLGNSTVFGGGVKCLRDMGPRGLEVALAEFHKAQAKLASATNAKETGALRAEMERWRETVDQDHPASQQGSGPTLSGGSMRRRLHRGRWILSGGFVLCCGR